MTVPFQLRFDFRNPDFAGTTCAERYRAALDMAEWGDRLGCVNISVSEHHGSPDGYIPSPLVLVAGMAARTRSVRFSVAALLAPFYDPIRLAEDMVVLDHMSEGRADLIVAGGYVREEFDMYGVSLKERPKRVTEMVQTLKAAFSGEPFEFRGRRVKVTPAPLRPGGPSILLGGSSEPAARRAARIADGFVPSVPEVWDFYRDEVQKLGRPDPGPPMFGATRTVMLAEDPEEGWRQMGPYFLHETNAYGAWRSEAEVASPYQVVEGVEQLREMDAYAVLTPGEYIEELKAMPTPFALFHPLVGGMPIELGWSTLRLFEKEVQPAFA